MESCAGVSVTAPAFVAGQVNRPFSMARLRGRALAAGRSKASAAWLRRPLGTGKPLSSRLACAWAALPPLSFSMVRWMALRS
jgi:hypothetical protein